MVHTTWLKPRLDMRTVAPAAAKAMLTLEAYALNAWRETPFYTARERAALEWTEAITRIGESRAPDDVYESVRSWFSDEEMVDLTMLIVTINGWNRLMMRFRAVPGE